MPIMDFFSGKAVKPQSRFEKSEDLKSLSPIVVNLRKKNKEMYLAAKGASAASNAFGKHAILLRITQNIDTLIVDFNSQSKKENDEDELKDVAILVKNLLNVFREPNSANISPLKNPETMKELDKLGALRNQRKETVNTVLNVGALTAAAIAVASNPAISLLKTAATMYGATQLSNTARSFIGLNDGDAESKKIVIQLITKLEDLDKKLDKHFLITHQETPNNSI